MRDPNRIPLILKKIEEIWLKVPDQRFCQLLYNIGVTDGKNYYLEDDQLETDYLHIYWNYND